MSMDKGPASLLDHLRRLRGSALLTGMSILALYVAAHPRLYKRLDSSVSDVIGSLQVQRLSREDRKLLERGYYENLLGMDRNNPELWNLYEQRPTEWRSLWQTEAVEWTNDLLRLQLAPSVSLSYKGETLTTNQWGMRDREYEREKPEGVFRIAVLGASPVMGSGVADGHTFEELLEDRLNAELGGAGAPRYELLNFAVESYTVMQQMYTLETKVLPFEPDAVMYVAHESEYEKTLGDLGNLRERRIELRYPFLDSITARADVGPGTKRSLAIRRLTPHAKELHARMYDWMGAFSREHGLAAYWVFMPMPARGVTGPVETANSAEPMVRELFDLARDAGFVQVDLSGVYDGTDLTTLWVATWDRHPNLKGHQLVADRLLEEMLPLLGKTPEPAAPPSGTRAATR